MLGHLVTMSRNRGRCYMIDFGSLDSEFDMAVLARNITPRHYLRNYKISFLAGQHDVKEHRKMRFYHSVRCPHYKEAN